MLRSPLPQPHSCATTRFRSDHIWWEAGGTSKPLCSYFEKIVLIRIVERLFMEVKQPVLAIVVPDLYHASVTFFHEHIAAIAPGKTVVVHISTTGEKAKTDVPVIEIVRPKNWVGPDIPLLRTVVRQLDEIRQYHLNRAQKSEIQKFFIENSVTHVLAEFANTAAMVSSVTRKMGLPLTSISHGWDINVVGQMPQWRVRYRRFFRSGVRLAAAGPILRDRMIDLGAPEETEVIPCAVHADCFTAVDQRAASPTRIVMVSRLTAQKGPLQSIEAFAKAARRADDMILEIVGDGPQMAEVCKAIADAGLQDRVVVHGALTHDQTLKILAKSHIFLQHGMTLPRQGIETQAVSLVEAMGHGLVPIVTTHGGMKLHVKSGERGWLVDEGDTDAMAKHLLDMKNSPELRQSIGSNARSYVLSNYTADKVYPKLRRLIGLQ